MYKKITHSIVEEHFDHPEAVKLARTVNKPTWKAPLRYFPDGTQVSSNMPISFRLATGQQNCGNCLAYDSATGICSKWSALTRPEYVCDAWTAKP
jgi:hypothetical protein